MSTDEMNQQMHLLAVVAVVVAVVAFLSDSHSSMSQTLSVLVACFIIHFYITKNLDDFFKADKLEIERIGKRFKGQLSNKDNLESRRPNTSDHIPDEPLATLLLQDNAVQRTDDLQDLVHADPYIKSDTQDIYRVTTTQVPNEMLQYPESIKGHEFEAASNY